LHIFLKNAKIFSIFKKAILRAAIFFKKNGGKSEPWQKKRRLTAALLPRKGKRRKVPQRPKFCPRQKESEKPDAAKLRGDPKK